MFMSQAPIKLIPRNVAALRRGQQPADGARPVPGNPVSTRLESGVGNCFPGLECDLRNLERRFFPFLEFNISDTSLTLVSVNMPGVQAALNAGLISAAMRAIYAELNAAVATGQIWTVREITGTFGPLGVHTIR